MRQALCNVFRIARILELAWVAAFLTFEGARLLMGTPSIHVVVGVSLACTVCVVFIELRRPSYHGVLWKAVNPGLRAWFDAHLAERGATDSQDEADSSA